MNGKSTLAKSLATMGLAALALTACGGESDAGGNGGAEAEEVVDVTLMLNWYPYGEHAPFYYGVEEGIFEAHGINLEIQAGQGSTRTVQAVGSGEVEFGWADTAPLLSNVESGVNVKSIGVYLQTTPSAVQVFSDSGITELEDLEGTTIAVSAGDAPTSTFPVFLEAAGIDPDSIQQQNLDSAGKVAAMIAGQVDGLIGFAHDQGPKIADQSGRDVSYFRYSDVGLNFFSNGLLTQQSTIDDDPDLVQRMSDATSAAFQAAAEDPEGAAEAMQGKDPQIASTEVVLGQWTETINLLTTENSEGQVPGWNADEDWQNTISVMSDAGLIEEEHPVDMFYDASFAPGEDS